MNMALAPRQGPFAFGSHELPDGLPFTESAIHFAPGKAIYSQGDPSEHVMYLQSGRIKLSVLSRMSCSVPSATTAMERTTALGRDADSGMEGVGSSSTGDSSAAVRAACGEGSAC